MRGRGFARWIDEAREDLRQERVLIRAAGEWLAAGQDPSFLLRGARLEQAEAWLQKTDLALGHDVRRYVVASIAERTRERDADEQRRVRETEVERRSARGSGHWWPSSPPPRWSRARSRSSRRIRGGARSGRRRSRRCESWPPHRSRTSKDDPELAVLLAVEAVERSRAGSDALGREAGGGLAPGNRRVADRGDDPDGTGVRSRQASTDRMSPAKMRRARAEWRSSIRRSTVRSRSMHTTGRSPTWRSHPNGASLITAGSDGWLRAWDPTMRRSSGVTTARDRPRTVIARCARLIVAASWHEAGRILVADASERTRRPDDIRPESVRGPFAAWRRSVPTARASRWSRRSGSRRIETGLDRPTHRPGPRRRQFRAPQYAGINGELSWSPDGAVSVGLLVRVGYLDRRFLHRPNTAPCVESSSWSPDGSRLVTGSGGTARCGGSGSNEFRSTCRCPPVGRAPSRMSRSPPGGAQVVTAAADAVRLWDVRLFGERRARESLVADRVRESVGASRIRGALLVVAADMSEHVADVFCVGSRDGDRHRRHSGHRRKLALSIAST